MENLILDLNHIAMFQGMLAPSSSGHSQEMDTEYREKHTYPVPEKPERVIPVGRI